MSTSTGIELKGARIRAGLRHYDLAARLGIAQTRLSEIECGRRPPAPELVDHILAAIKEACGGQAN
jgi:transcriptional regulator with XRE-family HTH domain